MSISLFFFAVFEIHNEDVDAIMKSLQSSSASVTNDGVVRLRGLPYSCTEMDISEFFSGDYIWVMIWRPQDEFAFLGIKWDKISV